MPNLTVSIPHQLTRAEAKKRIQDEVSKLRQQQPAFLTELRETWTGDTLAFTVAAMGQSVTGELRVEDQAVQVDVALPWLLAMLAGAVEERIEQRGQLLLGGPRSTSSK